jgi:hypothetical protein
MTTTPNPTTSSIEATLRDYIEGWYEGNAVRMDRSLHPDLVKRIPIRPNDGNPSEFREAGGGETPGAHYEIDVHHVSGRIASARVLSQEYLDYVHLVETADGWKIVNILFETHD